MTHLLTFHLGDAVYRVSQDVPPPAAGTVPPTLATLALPELREFYSGSRGWDPSPGTLAGSAAGNWTVLSDRMGYSANLFRAYHLVPDLFRPLEGDHDEQGWDG